MRCHLCNNNTLTEFLDLGQQPLANKYPKREEIEKEDLFPLKVLFCTTCKNAKIVIYIGSKDGILLNPLKERDIKALGVEPSKNVSKNANDACLTTITT